MRRPSPLLCLVLGAGLVLSACGDGEGAAPQAAPLPQEVTESEQLSQTWPTTGLQVEGEDSAALSRPVFVVKIDNTRGSAPQAGLDRADLVVEELVEGGVTRLAVFYYSELPKVTGPVRSMRATDIGIVAPIEGTMITSGAAAVTLNRVADAGLNYIGEGGPGIYRENARSAPYNVMADLARTAAGSEPQTPTRPVDYLPWGEAEDLPAGQPATSITARFSGAHATEWEFAGGRYVNTNSYAEPDGQFPADTVLVLRVKVGDAGYRDPAGNAVPESILQGKGAAMLFHNGRLVRGTWTKPALDAPLQLSTVAGDLTVPPGRTWIELVPAGTGEVTFRK